MTEEKTFEEKKKNTGLKNTNNQPLILHEKIEEEPEGDTKVETTQKTNKELVEPVETNHK